MSYFEKLRIWDGTYEAEVDKLGYLVGIDILHHKCHEGKDFTIEFLLRGNLLNPS